VLDYTSVVVPVTNVDKTVDKRVERYEAINERDEEIQGDCKLNFVFSTLDMWWWVGMRANRVVDDPQIYDGAHVSLQIVGRKLEEEKMIGIAEEVEKILSSA
jgi:amidase